MVTADIKNIVVNVAKGNKMSICPFILFDLDLYIFQQFDNYLKLIVGEKIV